MSAPPVDHLVRLNRVSKRYGNVEALVGLSMNVASGEIYGLLGPNGAGKTTALLCLAGLARPDTGEITVAGCDVAAQRRAAAASLAFIPDSPWLPERLTAREAGEYALGLRGLRRREAAARLTPWLSRFGLEEHAGALVGELSHGMRQKLVFVLALAADTPVLVIDEPMVGLDVPAQRLVREVLVEKAGRGHAVLLTTHTLDVAERLCKRVGILSRGRLLAEGSPASLVKGSLQADLEAVFLDLLAEAPHGG
jgi:ABC-2 type transport system ATP-binding protein